MGFYARKYDKLDSSSETFGLALDIHKNFLNYYTLTASKVLLLTEQTGIGKTLFCKRLQREILSNWISLRPQKPDEREWFAIYIEHSSVKKPKPAAIA